MNSYWFNLYILCFFTFCLTHHCHSITENNEPTTLILQNGKDGYHGTESFFTGQMKGGTFNSHQQRKGGMLRVAPLDFDTKAIIRFKKIPLKNKSFSKVTRIELVLSFLANATPDTLFVHTLNASDHWIQNLANYNTINGETPWSYTTENLMAVWKETPGVASISGAE